MSNNSEEDQKLSIDLAAEVAKGNYCNLTIISHSHSEFVFDFIQMMPGMPKAEVRSRIIMTPHSAKQLINALEDNLQKYEENFGEIPLFNQENNVPSGFGGPIGIA